MLFWKLHVIILFSFSITFLVKIFYETVDKLEATRLMNANLQSRILSSSEEPAFTTTTNNLFWFMQISDLHFSVFSDPIRASDFRKFCSQVLFLVRPEFLSVSGDLTDARSKLYLRSDQSDFEWATYSKVLRDSGVLNITKIFDIPGNHDMFGVISRNHTTDLYSKHSVRGRTNLRSYLYTITKPFGVYSFISLDASPTTGLKFPLNFFGELSNTDAAELRSLIAEARGSNHTFWFAHYPTATIVSTGLDLRNVLGESAFAYFCGHLHTLLHMVPRMYTLQPQGYLELELGDWKISRYFRVVAVDHDLVSFIDVKLPNDQYSVWPIVMVTNPKNSDFLLPYKEPVYRISHSTHVRILVWSIASITSVGVFIDGHFQGNASMVVDNSSYNCLFTMPWNATAWLANGPHTLQVEAIDSIGNRRTVVQPFNVNGTPTWSFGTAANFVLQSDHTFNARVIFYVIEFMFCILLVFPRLFPKRTISSRFLRNCRMVRGLHRFSHCSSVSLALLGYLLYLCVGPIFMGFLVGNHFGIVFSYGVFISRSFVLESLTYVYETIQLILLLVVFLPYVLWYCGGYPESEQRSSSASDLSAYDLFPHTSVPQIRYAAGRSLGSVPLSLFCHSLLFTFLQVGFILVSVAIPYGFLAALISPGRSGCIGLSWYIASRLTQELENW